MLFLDLFESSVQWGRTCTVFTDVQLFEVNQAGNGGW